jgi:hypothetical protein
MKEKQSIEGNWWIQGDEKLPYYGVLLFDPEEDIELTVKIPTREFVGSSSDVIHGEDEEGRPITLFGYGERPTQISDKLTTHNGRALRVLIGKKFSSWAEASFSSASFDFSLLFNWLGNSKVIDGTDLSSRPSFSLDAGGDIETPIGESAKLKITSNWDAKPDGSKFVIDQSNHVEIELKQPIPATEFINEYAIPFRNLLTLFSDTRVYLDRIQFLQPSQVELLMTTPRIGTANRMKESAWMLVRYEEIASEFPEIIRRWYEYRQQLTSVLNLYFSTVFNTDLYGHHKFLFLAQALEVYHRECSANFSSEAEPTPDFRKRRDTILGKLSDDEKAWLTPKLQYANQKVLARRLKEILDKHPDEIAAIIPDREKFAATVMNTRHYYTHFGDQKDKGKVAPFQELGLLLAQMRALLQICILKDLGITGKPIARVIQNYKDIRFVSI